MEFWSDSFQNFYCSPKTHDFIKTYLPKTYAFQKAMLAPPMWTREPGYIDPDAAAYADDVAILFNAASKSCDIVVKPLGMNLEEEGALEVELAIKDKDYPPVKLVLNAKVPLATQVSTLRRSIQTYFSHCPVE